MLRSAEGGNDNHLISVLFNFNETNVTVTPQDGLRSNKKYFYTVGAINSFGNVTSEHKILCK